MFYDVLWLSRNIKLNKHWYGVAFWGGPFVTGTTSPFQWWGGYRRRGDRIDKVTKIPESSRGVYYMAFARTKSYIINEEKKKKKCAVWVSVGRSMLFRIYYVAFLLTRFLWKGKSANGQLTLHFSHFAITSDMAYKWCENVTQQHDWFTLTNTRYYPFYTTDNRDTHTNTKSVYKPRRDIFVR